MRVCIMFLNVNYIDILLGTHRAHKLKRKVCAHAHCDIVKNNNGGGGDDAADVYNFEKRWKTKTSAATRHRPMGSVANAYKGC